MSNPTPLAHSLWSAMHLYNRRYEDAISEAKRRAIELNTNSPAGYLALADALLFSGQSLEAIEMANTAIRLDPNFAAPYLATQGLAQYNLRNFDEAVETLLRSIAINPNDQVPFLILVAAYGQLEQLDQASLVLDQVNNQFQQDYGRKFSIDLLRDQFPFQDRLDREHLLEGLQKAGAPEF